LEVTSQVQAQDLVRMNGFIYIDHQQLTIRLLTGDDHTNDLHEPAHKLAPASTTTHYKPTPIPAALERAEVTTLLQQFIQSRYHAPQQLLNLSNVAAEPLLMKSLDRLTTGAWTALLKSASVVCPQVTTISFATNQLRTLHPLVALGEHLPNVHNLSFEGNLIADLTSLDPCLGRLQYLRELLLSGNPVEQQMVSSGKEEQYRGYDVDKLKRNGLIFVI
jgi:hypothetical protein